MSMRIFRLIIDRITVKYLSPRPQSVKKLFRMCRFREGYDDLVTSCYVFVTRLFNSINRLSCLVTSYKRNSIFSMCAGGRDWGLVILLHCYKKKIDRDRPTPPMVFGVTDFVTTLLRLLRPLRSSLHVPTFQRISHET